MARKAALKTALFEEQDGLDALTQEPLPAKLSLTDTHRKRAKSDGGTYKTRANVRLVSPVTHMEEHGTLRLRAEWLEQLKAAFDDRTQIMRYMLRNDNQVQAYKRRTDWLHPETLTFLSDQLTPLKKRLAVLDRAVAKILKASPDPLVKAALSVKGLGPITVAALTCYIDFEKLVCATCRKPVGVERPGRPADEGEKAEGKGVCICKGEIKLIEAASTVSSLWKYVGLDKPSHARYEKKKASGGNKTLRTVLWTTAISMMQGRTPGYRDIYDQVRARLAASEIVTTTRLPNCELVQRPWKDTMDSHQHGAALRKMMKVLLADYWVVGRTLAGKDARPLYAEEKLGHVHIANPRARGWKY